MRIAAYVGVLVAVAAQIIAVVQHFIVKVSFVLDLIWESATDLRATLLRNVSRTQLEPGLSM